MTKPCTCGSHKARFELYNEHGIFLDLVCTRCVDAKARVYEHVRYDEDADAANEPAMDSPYVPFTDTTMVEF